MKWVKPPLDSAAVRLLASQFGTGLLEASILYRRGITEAEQIAYFLENDEHFLHNPFIFPQMERAVERVLEAAAQQEHVLICGDRDTDGITATVLMHEALDMVGLDARWRVPTGEEHYGLNPEVLTQAAGEDVTLIITVDCGISDFAEVELANSLGMDVLIFDHHVPRENRLPDAFAIVNPKVPDSYPFDGLCAAAVVSKFQWALALARTDIYGEEFCLITAEELGAPAQAGGPEQAGTPAQAGGPEQAGTPERPGGPERPGAPAQGPGTLVVEALKMRNLMETGRIRVDSAQGEAARSKLLAFIEGCPLLAYNVREHVPLVSRFFSGAEVYAMDAAPRICRAFPSLQGLSLKQLEKHSRRARYFPSSRGASGVFAGLVSAMQFKSVSAAFEPWRRGLDLAALGTLADLMPLENENRILVRLGLARLNGTDGIKERRAALRELLLRCNLHEGQLDAKELSWKISPLINSSGRMGRADRGVSLFLETAPAELTARADELITLNRERRALGEECWEKLKPLAWQSLENLDGKMVIVQDSQVPRGITGILASRFHKTMHVPSVVISLNAGKASGSIRSDEKMNVQHWLEAMKPLLDDFGGHFQAGGFLMAGENMARLIEQTRRWLKSAPVQAPENEEIVVDAELTQTEFARMGETGLKELLERLAPYGKGFGPLTFLTRSVRIAGASLVGKVQSNHLKLQVELGDRVWPALWWNGADRYGEDIKIDGRVDLVYRIDTDRYQGRESSRLTIIEAFPCI